MLETGVVKAFSFAFSVRCPPLQPTTHGRTCFLVLRPNTTISHMRTAVLAYLGRSSPTTLKADIAERSHSAIRLR